MKGGGLLASSSVLSALSQRGLAGLLTASRSREARQLPVFQRRTIITLRHIVHRINALNGRGNSKGDVFRVLSREVQPC